MVPPPSAGAPPPPGVAAATPQAARQPPSPLPTEGTRRLPPARTPASPPPAVPAAGVAALHPARATCAPCQRRHTGSGLSCSVAPSGTPPLVAHARDAAGDPVGFGGRRPHPCHPGRRLCRSRACAAPHSRRPWALPRRAPPPPAARGGGGGQSCGERRSRRTGRVAAAALCRRRGRGWARRNDVELPRANGDRSDLRPSA